MSTVFTLYVIDERKLPKTLPGRSDANKHAQIVAAVTSQGAQWETIQLRETEFAKALEAIDQEMGATKFLPVFAFNNSPHNVLGDDSDAPCFGYFSPEQTQDLTACLNDVPDDVIADLVKAHGRAVESVFHAFQSAADEAAKRSYALAVIHG
jgi:hypothetical protein